MFEKELAAARAQFARLSDMGRAAVEGELEKAVIARDPTQLKRALQVSHGHHGYPF